MRKTFIEWLKSLQKPKWKCYEFHRANMPQYGCTSQCNQCKLEQYE